jgi:hypothetical protein
LEKEEWGGFRIQPPSPSNDVFKLVITECGKMSFVYNIEYSTPPTAALEVSTVKELVGSLFGKVKDVFEKEYASKGGKADSDNRVGISDTT